MASGGEAEGRDSGSILTSNLAPTNPVPSAEKKEIDIFRDSPVRYLGYANEVGESFRALIHVNLVRLTYAVASTYVCADAYHKGSQAKEHNWPDERTGRKKAMHAVLDTLLWQGLASVAIPGFTINRICFLTNLLLKSTALPVTVRKWTTTAIGLGAIPFIIRPIDSLVDYGMDNTVRCWYHIGPIEDTIVHHNRNE